MAALTGTGLLPGLLWALLAAPAGGLRAPRRAASGPRPGGDSTQRNCAGYMFGDGSDSLATEAIDQTTNNTFPFEKEFKFYDKDGDGKISKRDLFRRLMWSTTCSDAARCAAGTNQHSSYVLRNAIFVLECSDANNNGFIDKEEWTAAWQDTCKGCLAQKLQAFSNAPYFFSWASLDVGPHDGCVNAQELETMYIKMVLNTSYRIERAEASVLRAFTNRAVTCLDDKGNGCLTPEELGCWDTCPAACRCEPGGSHNGGLRLVDGECPEYCSPEHPEYGDVRYCGKGPDYEIAGSVYCGKCKEHDELFKRHGTTVFCSESPLNLAHRPGKLVVYDPLTGRASPGSEDAPVAGCLRVALARMEKDLQFVTMDGNGDGLLSQQEFYDWAGDAKFAMNHTLAQRLFGDADLDGDGFVSQDEFAAAGPRHEGDGKGKLLFF